MAIVMLGVALTAGAGGGVSGGSAPASAPVDEAWVATGASVTLPGNAVTPVDLRTRQVQAKVHLGSLPSALAFTKNDAALLVTSQGTDKLTEIDPASGRVMRSVTVGVEPDAVAVAPGGPAGKGMALVANLDSNSVTPVDLGTWKAGKPIPVGTEPVAVAIDASNGHDGTAFVADFGSNQVTPINLATLTPGTAIAVGPSPETVAVARPSDQLLVGNFGNDSLTVITASTLAPVSTIALPLNPTDVVVNAAKTTAYISGGASIVPLTLAGLALGTPIRLPDVAQAVAFDPRGTTAWVALQAGSLVPVTLATGVVGRAIHLGGHPSALVIATR
jgi:YVTN family beta-propeller protein